MHASKVGFALSFIVDGEPRQFNEVLRLLEKMDDKFKRKIALLNEKFREKLDRIIESYNRMKELEKHVEHFSRIIKWDEYYRLRENLKEPIEEEFTKSGSDFPEECQESIRKLILHTESEKLRKIFEGETFTFRLINISINQ